MGFFDKFKKDTSISILSPVTGEVVDVTEVSDPVFAQKMVGDGIAINPASGEVVAPGDGEIKTMFPTGHALGMEIDGVEILIHLGMDTVELKGVGFKAHVAQGDKVVAGQLLVTMDVEAIKAAGYSVLSPVVITNMETVSELGKELGDAEAGTSAILKVRKNK